MLARRDFLLFREIANSFFNRSVFAPVGCRCPGSFAPNLAVGVSHPQEANRARREKDFHPYKDDNVRDPEPAPIFCLFCPSFTLVRFATVKSECAFSRGNQQRNQPMLNDWREPPMPVEDKNVTPKIVAAALVVLGFGAIGAAMYENGSWTAQPNAPATTVAQNTAAPTQALPESTAAADTTAAESSAAPISSPEPPVPAKSAAVEPSSAVTDQSAKSSPPPVRIARQQARAETPSKPETAPAVITPPAPPAVNTPTAPTAEAPIDKAPAPETPAAAPASEPVPASPPADAPAPAQ